jgi:hypothetical protein
MMEKLNKLRQVKDSVYKHEPNDEDNKLTIEELCLMYPNDADLGKEIRKIAMSIKKKCDCFHSYDDYMDDQERLCANCGQEESKH